MSEPINRTDFSRGEVIGALVWLGIGAAVSVLLEVVYLGGLFGVPSIVAAFLFCGVLTRTARLWTPITAVVLIPLVVWVGAFLLLIAVLPASGNQLVPNDVSTVVLMLSGIAGGIWPLLRRQ